MSSVKFSPRLGEDGRKRALIVFLALLAAGLYVGLSSAGGQAGFPLDDSWIHQTYARNLAETGRWEYVPGQVSAGSTAPLWTLLLAVGYFLRLPYLLWAYLMGGLCLAWVGLAGMALWQTLWPQHRKYGWLAGVVLVFTWPLVWAAASGMETVLFAALALQILVLYSWLAAGSPANRSISNNRLTAVLGFLCGLLILVRPDGLGLLLLILAGLWLVTANNRLRLAYAAVFILAAVLPLLPYFAFNL
jgi:hypothetical protein